MRATVTPKNNIETPKRRKGVIKVEATNPMTASAKAHQETIFVAKRFDFVKMSLRRILRATFKSAKSTMYPKGTQA